MLNRRYGTMKLMFRKVFTAAFIIFLFPVFVLNSFAFSDLSGHWAEEVIIKWADKEVVRGLPDGTFRPDAYITRAEFVTVLNNVMKYVNKSDEKFNDVSENDWFAENVAKAVAAGVTVGTGSGGFGPSNLITRQEAAVMIYRAFRMQVKDRNAADKYSDAGQIASWAKDAVSALTENGYVSGRPGNRFAPLDNITRAEALKIIDNILGDIVNTPGGYTGEIEKSLLVNTGDVTLKDMLIDGSLYLSEGVDDGTVVLDGVTVRGDVFVLGGGEGGIILKNTVVEGTMQVMKYDGKAGIVAEGSTEVKNILVLSGVKLREENVTAAGFGNIRVISLKQGEKTVLDGVFDEVELNTEGAGIIIENGSVAALNIGSDAYGTLVEIAENAEVNTMLIGASATVKGNGSVKNAEIKADQVSIEMIPENYRIYKGFTANIGGTETTGDYVPEEETAAKIEPTVIYLSISGQRVDGIFTGNGSAEIDLAGYDNSDRVEFIKIDAVPQDAVLKITSVNGIPFELEIAGIDEKITVASLLGSDNDSISLGTIRGVFGSIVTIKGTLSKSGYDSLDVNLTIKLGE